MNNVLGTIAFILLPVLAVAQPGGHGGGHGKPGEESFQGEIYGVIQDSVTEEALEYVVIKLYDQKTGDQKGGVITNDKGGFSLAITKEGLYKVEASFVGYNTKVFESIKVDEKTPAKNLGKIGVSPSILDGVEVIGDVPLVTYEIDKKVVNVEDQNTNVGQTAADVLANVPSITVDSEGNVSLRGSSSFTLLINNVPTVMDPATALATIPASTIKEIEIITNPSARFDAEGSSGIINIITKRKRLEGVSLMTNINGGTFNNYGGDMALSVGKKNFTFNVSADYNSRNRPRDIEKIRTMYFDTTTTSIESNGQGGWQSTSYGVNGEIQWTPNTSHTFILASSANRRNMVPQYDLYFDEYTDGALITSYFNQQNMIIDMTGFSASLFYEYKIKRNKNHTITLKAINNQKDVDQLDSTMFYDLEGNLTGGTKYTEIGPSDFNRFNIDYIRPTKNGRFEIGAQAQLGASADDGKNYFYDSLAQDFVLNAQFSSNVDYTRDVYAGYAIWNGKYKDLGYQIGLRGEYTYRTIVADNFPDFATINRMDWFPSAHFSYNFNEESQLLVSYSRRIQRPRSWYFEPFITWETAYNVRTGNPDLLPEYINSFEINWIKQLDDKKGFVSVETYFKSTTGLINRVSTAYEENVLITRPYNIGASMSMGVEPSLNYKFKDWWEINTSANLFYLDVSGDIEDIGFVNTSFNVKGRFTNTFKVKEGWQFQVVAEYNSPTATAQGERIGFFVLDASIRKSFSEGKYSFNLAGKNVVGTQKDHNIIITPDLYLIRNNTPLFPRVTLTFSMKLNNYKKVMSRHEDADDF